jgi:hypothetical protein
MGMMGGLPPKPKITPRRQMRQLQWSKLPAPKVAKTLWKELGEEEEAIRIVINIDDLENMFGTQSPTTPHPDSKCFVLSTL